MYKRRSFPRLTFVITRAISYVERPDRNVQATWYLRTMLWLCAHRWLCFPSLVIYLIIISHTFFFVTFVHTCWYFNNIFYNFFHSFHTFLYLSHFHSYFSHYFSNVFCIFIFKNFIFKVNNQNKRLQRKFSSTFADNHNLFDDEKILNASSTTSRLVCRRAIFLSPLTLIDCLPIRRKKKTTLHLFVNQSNR